MSFDYADFSAAFPWFFPFWAGVFGAIVGSFLNVVIYRMPAGRSIVTPGSHCACGKPIAWYDNIPILSWLLLRGRARCCGRSFSFRYPAIEALTGVLFVLCCVEFPPAKALCGMLFVSILICATFIDLDHMIIPDAFTIYAGVIGVALSLFVPALHGYMGHEFPLDEFRSFTASLVGLLVGSALVLWIALLAEAVLKKEAMGFGDVTFVGMIGAFTGWQGAVSSIFGGAVVGTAWLILARLWQAVRHGSRKIQLDLTEEEVLATASNRMEAALAAEHEAHLEHAEHRLAFGSRVPFGPMLAAGAALHFLWLHGYVEAYFRQAAELFHP